MNFRTHASKIQVTISTANSRRKTQGGYDTFIGEINKNPRRKHQSPPHANWDPRRLNKSLDLFKCYENMFWVQYVSDKEAGDSFTRDQNEERISFK